MSDAPLTLVTGATGFVGSAVARTFAARGHRLRLLTRPNSDRRNLHGVDAEIVTGDLLDPPSLERAVRGCRFVAHVAADYRLWVPDPGPMNRANVDGTRALLRSARDAGAERIVYCSSVAALGLIGDGTPGTEDTPNSAEEVVGNYKLSKYHAEQAVLALVRDEGVPAVIVNPSAPVGPRDIKPTATGKMVADYAARRNRAYVESGLNIVHVDDVAEGHALALERGLVGERYILGGEDLLMSDVVRLIADVAGIPAPRLRLPIGALVPIALGAEWGARLTGREPFVTREMLTMARKKMFFSSGKAQRELGYTFRPPRVAVADAVAWFRQIGAVPR